jgi:phage shock protein PspC (stress-responsive transcriptional regulator)
MKKTVKINIGGVIFHLDDDAYQILQNYLTAINQRFASNNEGKEIITDIEHRIAEILQSKLTEQKQVISKEDIDEVIEIMGRPEDFESEEENNGTDYQQQNKTSKRLYRDPDDRVLGGVCSGIGTYLNIDPIIIRILFLVLIIGYGIIGIIYIVLWALLPAANTTAQKLDMRGENFNISDIEKNVRKEYENVKNNFKNMKNSKDYDRTRGFFESLIYAIGAFFRFILRFIVAVFGLVLVVAGVGFLLGITGTFIIGEPFMPWNNLIINDHVIISDMFHSFMDPNTVWLVVICSVLVVFIPLVGIIYGGLKLLLGLRPNDRSVAGIGFLAWILSLIVLVVVVGSQVKDFSHSVVDDETLIIDEPANKTLYLTTRKDNSIETSRFYIFDEEFQIMYDESDEKQLYAYPEIDIIRGHADHIIIEIEKEGRGSNRREALENADDIEYHVIQKDSIILFDAVYSLIDKNRWKFPEVDITIKVPEGYILYLDESIEEQLDYIKKEDYYRNDEMINKYWKMTEDGLERHYKKNSNME